MSLDIDNKNSVFACYINDNKIRMESSSGGIFSIIAEWVIKQNGIVFGAAFDNNFKLQHIGIERIDDIEKLRGSKYVQSNIANTYIEAKTQLETGRKVLYSGTPCQIRALKKYLRKEYDNLITIDVICHGVPSPMIWDRYLKEVARNNTITGIDFRNKENGWKNYSIKIQVENNIYSNLFYNDYYMKSFLDNYILRPSCYYCNSKQHNVVSDLSIGDCWGAEYIAQDIDDDKGLSLLFVNTDKGKEIFNLLRENMVIKSISGKDACIYNPCLIKSVEMQKKRSTFFNCVIKGKSIQYSYNYCKNGSLIRRVLRKCKNMVKRKR